jgi:hypothetical protein
MVFKLEEVVPWGRSFDEYMAMFSLQESDLDKRILGCGDGPASFNAVATERGFTITSTDPVYAFSADTIRGRIEESVPVISEQIQNNQEEFVWNYFGSIAELISTRVSAMELFLNDFPDGFSTGRYIDASLPTLPFNNNEFDIALCSHFLFLYSKQNSMAFHLDAILEMCRIASEVRIFPLLELGSVRSRHLDSIINELRAREFSADIVPVNYEFQVGGNEMLQIHAA